MPNDIFDKINTLLAAAAYNMKKWVIIRINYLEPINPSNNMKTLPLYAWDKENLWWTIAHTEVALSNLVNFCEFINYYSTKGINEISQEEIQAYLLYLIEERQVSTSYQNQAINAIKFYFEKVLRGPRRIYYIEPPRKEKLLPTVLSEPETHRY